MFCLQFVMTVVMLILIILFVLPETENYMFLWSLYQQKNNQKLPKRLSKGFERSVYCNEHRKKSEDKNMTNKYRYFLESNFVGVTRFLVLVYSNQDDDAKSIKPDGILHRKGYQKLQCHHQLKKKII